MNVQAQFSRLPGGRYRARQGDDGKWDVFDVPVFSVVPKGVKGAPKDIKQTDLEAAVLLHNRLFSEDEFAARVNTLHNYGIHKASPAGFFLPKSVRSFRMKGQRLPVVFADLLSIEDSVFRDLDSDRLPYCSVEIKSWEPLQFGALALLDTEPPFFEFPLISIGDRQEAVTTSADITQFQTHQQAPAVAAFVSGTGARFLFRFEQGDIMPDDEKEKDEGQMQEGEGGSDLASAIKAIEEQMKALEPILGLADKIAALVETDTSEEPEVETEEEVKAEGPVEMKADESEAEMVDEEGTKTEARLSALEDYREAAEREKKRDALFNEAVDGLEADGYHLTEGSRKRLFAAAEQGNATLELFLTEYRETAIKDPPPDLEGLEPGEEAWPSEVMQFSAEGPEAFAEAKRAYREWQELKNTKAFGATLSSLDKYLARNMQKGG